MKLRVITGLIFGVFMIAGTLTAPISSAILYLVVGILCLWEFAGLVMVTDSPDPYNLIRRITAVFVGIMPALLLFDLLVSPFPIYHSGYAHWFLPLFFAPFILELSAHSTKPFHNIAFSMLGIVYIGLPTVLLTALSLNHDAGRFLIMALVLLVWSNDVFAYFIGSKFGKTKLSPHISPNKTWEGTFGGMFSALLMGVISYFAWVNIEYELWQWLILAFCCSLFGILGDLIESMLKRSLNIKDSGNTLPGHGGMLDRFDAFIFALPFIAFVIVFIFNDLRFFAS